MSGRLAAARYSWRKLSALKWSDSWMERLSFLGPQRVMIIELAGARTARVEAHGLTKKEGDALVKMFGGTLREAKWLTAVNPPDRPPIRVRGRLVVYSTVKEMEAHGAGAGKEGAAGNRSRARAGARVEVRGAGTPALLIPAGMAFGTGEHATTATCLRLLVDVSRTQPEGWEMLDLGTGSGILAIAGRTLGARRVEAGDFDPHAVRTAKENVKANGVDRVVVCKMDVRAWQPERTWNVVAANLFSGLHLEVAPKYTKAVAPGGKLIFSGILREQEAEVTGAIRQAGFAIEKLVRKGKWVSGLATRGA
ncbi:MAG TPA: 50S ribosomal protein L11 methyltransferase [Chthoniobacteraceae bacterium]|jgi:ribosomal protein L11 methyltransferase|nr:50S ribosomal protein L11 methyltransferase [Chthoniobacteraceae bacterium]